MESYFPPYSISNGKQKKHFQDVPQIRGKHFSDETIQGSVTARDDATEDRGHNQVVRLVVDKVHSSGAQARGDCREDQEELATETVHKQHRNQISRQCRGDCDQGFHEHSTGNGRRTGTLTRVTALVDNKSCHLADARLLARVVSRKLVEAVEQLREPHHEAVVADVEGEVDGDGDERELQDGRNEQSLTVVHNVGQHGHVLALGARFHLLQLLTQLLVDQQLLHRVLLLRLARVRYEDAAKDGQCLLVATAGNQELWTLRQVEQKAGYDKRGDGADHEEDAPRVVGEGGRGEANRRGDDPPGEPGHQQITNGPEGGHEAQHRATLRLGLELGKVGPNDGTTATQPDQR